LPASGKDTGKKRITLKYEHELQESTEIAPKQQQNQLKSNINQLFSGNRKPPGLSNNVQIWRDNYTASKNNADLSANSPFGTCNLCNAANYFCACNSFEDQEDFTELESS